MNRPCDRCGAMPEFGNEDNNFAEFSFASTVLAWLCFDCRKDWIRVFVKSPLKQALETAQFKIEFFEGSLGLENSPNLTEGLGYLQERQSIEKQLNTLAEKWLRSVTGLEL